MAASDAPGSAAAGTIGALVSAGIQPNGAAATAAASAIANANASPRRRRACKREPFGCGAALDALCVRHSV
jgi:hypothetical protein